MLCSNPFMAFRVGGDMVLPEDGRPQAVDGKDVLGRADFAGEWRIG